MKRHPAPAARRAAGITLIETATVAAIVALIAGSVLPGFQEARMRRQLEGVAAQLETDLQLARAEAVARNEGIRVGFSHDAGGSCYVLHSGPAGSCRCDGQGTTVCQPGAEALRSVPLDARHPVRLQSNSGSIVFDPVKGTLTPTATLRLTSPAGRLHLVANVMGRVRSCTPDGAMPGYRRC